MMKRAIWIIVVLSSCEYENLEEQTTNTNYIVFGHFYGFCVGEKCIEIFKLTSTTLYEDTNDKYPSLSQPYEGTFQQLDQALFEKVKDLRTKVPQELLATDSGVIGQPDAGDWGGLYFEISIQGKKQFWLIDKMRTNLPEYLKPFADDIESAIALINS
jgi:hypothetical protein